MHLHIDIADYLPAGQSQYKFLLEPPAPDEAKKRDRENHILKREMAEDELTEKKKKKRKGGDSRQINLTHKMLHARHKVFDPRLGALLKNMAELRRRTHEVGPQLIEFLLVLRRFGLRRAMHHLQLIGATAHLGTHLGVMQELGLMPPALAAKLERMVGHNVDVAPRQSGFHPQRPHTQSAIRRNFMAPRLAR